MHGLQKRSCCDGKISKNKSKMFTPKFIITNKTNNNIEEIERARGFLEVAELKSEWLSKSQNKH